MIFRNWVLQNFPFLEDDFDALTDYELFCKMVEYMRKSLDKIKDFQKDIDAFTIKLDEFQHYFDTLDVQEEIDNKLDEMAESGELAEIIAEYLNLITNLVFNTVDDMKAAENLANGNYVKTLGFYEVGDGGSAYYHIRTVLNDDDIDEHFIIAVANENLVAEFQPIERDIHSKQLGLKGDDETDETAIIQKFFNYENNWAVNKIFDSGIYVISDTIYVKGKDQQDGNDGSGYENGVGRIQFNDASFHHINPTDDDYSFIFYKFWEGVIDGFTMTRNSGKTKIAFSGCKALVFRNFEVKSLEFNTDPELIPEVLRFYWISQVTLKDGYIRGKMIINPYNETTHYINWLNFQNVELFSYGQDMCVLLDKTFSKQELLFYNCSFGYSNNCIFHLNARQVYPSLATGVGSCSIITYGCYYDNNVPLFNDCNHNNVRYIDFGTRYSGNQDQNEPQTMEEYFTTTKIGLSSNYVKNQLPMSNLNYTENGNIKSHTYESSNSARLFGVSSTEVTKSYETTDYQKYGYKRRLVFNSNANVQLDANGYKAFYKAPAVVGLVFEVVSGSCDIKYCIGNVDQQWDVIPASRIKQGINFFSGGRNSQIFNQGAWLDFKLSFENVEAGTTIDIYEIGIQQGEIYVLNAPCISDKFW